MKSNIYLLLYLLLYITNGILALIETWISNDDSPIFSQLKQINDILIIIYIIIH